MELGAFVVGTALLEHAVGVTRDPLLSKGTYPRHAAYSDAHVALLASGADRHELYESLHLDTQASVVAVVDEAA